MRLLQEGEDTVIKIESNNGNKLTFSTYTIEGTDMLGIELSKDGNLIKSVPGMQISKGFDDLKALLKLLK